MKHKFIATCVALCAAFVCNFGANAQTTTSAKPTTAGKPSTAATAYSRIEPFVNLETFLVVRLDLDALDVDAFLNTLDGVFVGFLEERGFDAPQRLNVNREFKRGLDALKEQLVPVIEMRKAFNLREIFVIVQHQTDESIRFFAPMSQSKKDALVGAVALSLPNLQFVDAPGGVAVVTDLAADKKIYASFEPRANGSLKTFFEQSAGTSVQIYCATLNFRQIFSQGEKSGLNFDDSLNNLPAETRAAFTTFDSYFKDLRATIDVNSLEINVEIDFTTGERAESFRVGLEKFADYMVDDYFNSNPDAAALFFPEMTKEDVEKYNLTPLMRAFARASAKKLVPERSNATLLYRMDPKSKDLFHNSAALQIVVLPMLNSFFNGLLK